MNLYTFASKRFHKKYLIILSLFYFLFGLSFFLFLARPQTFYWRAWEYFDEIVYQIPNAKSWNSYEKGGDSRDYIYSFQNRWKTKVSSDSEGFRSVPLQTDKYPILVVGDSHIWGSNLSNSETIPWILSKLLGIPVFNGARHAGSLCNILRHPKLKEAKIIIELVAEHLLDKNGVLFSEEFQLKQYQPYINPKKYSNFFKIHPNRYFIPTKILRHFSVLSFRNELTKKELDTFLINHQIITKLAVTEEAAIKIALNIAKRDRILKSLGYEYIFGIIPYKNFILSKNKAKESIRSQNIFIELLKQKGVNIIDFNKVFRESAQPEQLYFQSDLHINSNGTLLIAETLSSYLKENFKTFL